jgi:hypothetical protein
MAYRLGVLQTITLSAQVVLLLEQVWGRQLTRFEAGQGG